MKILSNKEYYHLMNKVDTLTKLTQDTFFMSYSPLPIYGLDSCPIRAYAIEGLAEFSR